MATPVRRLPRASRQELLDLVYLLVATSPLLRELASTINGLSGRQRLRLRRLADATDEMAPRLPPQPPAPTATADRRRKDRG